MPVTTYPAPHGAEAWGSKYKPKEVTQNAEQLLKQVSDVEFDKMSTMIASSYGDTAPVYGYRNGFVHGAIEAYNKHHHLILRPEDIWFSILTQLSFYINKHAEELRGKFVAHDGQKTLTVIQGATLFTADYGSLARDMSQVIQDNVVDPDLRAWMMPDFTTTTKNDQVVASVIMMGSMQKYFAYEFMLLCGIPSVTLLGERADWEKLIMRLDKLLTFGEEPSAWYKLLKPVLKRFVHTFDAPEAAETKDFWQTIAHQFGGGSFKPYYGGWITAFCFWNNEGDLLADIDRIDPPNAKTEKAYRFADSTRDKDTPNESDLAGDFLRSASLVLDSAMYHNVDTELVPAGCAAVPVIVNDNGVEHQTRMMAGSVGIRVTGGESAAVLDTVQPVSGWFVFEVKGDDSPHDKGEGSVEEK